MFRHSREACACVGGVLVPAKLVPAQAGSGNPETYKILDSASSAE